MSDKKNVLLFVQIPTHFREIWRVAKLLKASTQYNPIVYFQGLYVNYQQDLALCRSQQIDVLTCEDLHQFHPGVIQAHQQMQQQDQANRDDVVKNSFIKSSVMRKLTSLKYTVKSIIQTHKEIRFRVNNKVKVRRGFVDFMIRNIIAPIILLYSVFFSLAGQTIRYVKYSCLRWRYRLLYFYYRGKSKCIYYATRANSNIAKTVYSMIYLTARYVQMPWRLLIKCYPSMWENGSALLPLDSKESSFISKSLPEFLKRHQITLILLPEHNLFYYTQLFAHYAKAANIPAVIVPFTIANTVEWCEAFYQEPSFSMKFAINRLMAKRFPHWTIQYKNKTMILPPGIILMNEMLNTTPKNPWLLNSGEIDAIAVESPAMNEYYIQAGIDEKVLRVTGTLYDDEIYQHLLQADQRRKDLYQQLGFSDVTKPMLLCALPPNQMDGRQSIMEFQYFEQVIRAFLQGIANVADDYNVVINLHPRLYESDITYCSQYPVKIARQNIAELVPLSALFVACCSATIRMAISCGIPVVNYDIYRYHYADYSDAEGVITLDTYQDFQDILKQLAVNNDVYRDYKNKQEKVSQRWGKVDGQSGQRMIELFDQLT